MVPEFIVVQVGSGSIFQPQSTVVTSDYSSTPRSGGNCNKTGDEVSRPEGPRAGVGFLGRGSQPLPTS